MNERDEYLLQVATDRFERRLAEETGKVRVDMAEGFGGLRADLANLRADMAGVRGDLRSDVGALRSEMIERDHKLLKWILVMGSGQVAAIAALLALFT